MSERELQEMLEIVRGEYQPSDEDRDRVYRAVMAAPGLSAPTAGAGKGISSLTLLKGFGATVVTIGLAMAVYNHFSAPPASSDAKEVSAVEHPQNSAVPTAPAAEVSDTEIAGAPTPTTGPAPAPATAPAMAPTRVSATTTAAIPDDVPLSHRKHRAQPVRQPNDTLAAEMKLVSRAAVEINGGHHRAAITLLQKHRRSFPEGIMAQERDGLEIIALCSSGQDARAQKKYSTFRRNSPNAPILMRITKTCGYQ